jgi:hypothetical protein
LIVIQVSFERNYIMNDTPNQNTTPAKPATPASNPQHTQGNPQQGNQQQNQGDKKSGSDKPGQQQQK